MERTDFGSMACPIARSLEHVGESWSILILRDCYYGFTRFDEFQKSLDIAPNMLTRRLNSLVEAGLLERRLYCERPPRHEYVLTESGRAFRPVMLAMLGWGNKYFAPEGESLILVDRATGQRADPVLIDRVTGKEINDVNHVTEAGPAATDKVRWRMALRDQKRAAAEGERK
jgi:DNA-binding HxlR family transcriptional regulator